jgi:hypothetical protein
MYHNLEEPAKVTKNHFSDFHNFHSDVYCPAFAVLLLYFVVHNANISRELF